MPKDFVVVQQARIRKSTIKFYEPISILNLIVYYNIARTEKRIFKFATVEDRNDIIELLDALL